MPAEKIFSNVLSPLRCAVNMPSSEQRYLSLFGLTPRISSAASMTAGHDFSHLLLTLTILKRYKLLASAIFT